jgi:hypothetical protein
MTETLFLGLVLAVFCSFGAALAWIDYAGKDLRQPVSDPAE